MPDTFAIPFTIALAETAASLGEVNVPVQARSPLPARQGEFAMQPVVPSSGVCEVDGPFGGDSAKTQAAVNDQPAQILAETRRQLFFRPRALRDGRNGVKITEGPTITSFDLIAPAVSIQASKTTLAQNETAEVEVHVSKMADSGWGSPARGALLLTIKNNSPDTVSFSGASGEVITRMLGPDDFVNGEHVERTTITARQAGTFDLDATIDPKMPKVHGREHGVLLAERTEPTPTANRPPPKEPTPVRDRELGPPVEFVPGVPIVAPPECCVITSITLTNNEDFPVFYVFNGKYQSGMSPPPAQWVQPHKSRTFKGDFGPCVRIEAFNNQSVDPEGNPLPAVFDDQTICCKAMVSGKKKVKGFTYSIDSIELREWKDCPEKEAESRRHRPGLRQRARRRRPGPRRPPRPRRRHRLTRRRRPACRRRLPPRRRLSSLRLPKQPTVRSVARDAPR